LGRHRIGIFLQESIGSVTGAARKGEKGSKIGWRADLSMDFEHRLNRTVLSACKRSGPLTVQRPFYPEGAPCHLYLLHPPGGVVGGDDLNIEARLDARAHALFTMPGATKFYRTAGPTARVKQQLQVASDATLEWLPQENILFPGARLAMDTEVKLVGDARLILWDIQCLGRPAIDEAFAGGQLNNRLAISRDDTPVLLERLRVDDRNSHRRSLLNGQPVCATMVVSHADASTLEQCRLNMPDLAGDEAGFTLLEDFLLVRYVGHSTERVRNWFTALWLDLREPVLGIPPVAPRIWAT
jgi:urease accessory protein